MGHGTTYGSVVDTVDAWVGHIPQLLTLVLNRVDTQVSDLVEGPAADATAKLQVPCLDSRLLARALDLSIEPLVLERCGRAHNGEASRVTRLEDRDQIQLLTSGENLVHHLLLILLVVDVCGARRPEDGGQLGTVAEDMAERAGERDHVGVAAGEVILGAGPVTGRGLEKDDIVVISGARDVVVEVVDHEACSLAGNVNIELEKDVVQGSWDGGVGAESDQDVTACIEEVEDELCCQVRTEAWSMASLISVHFPEVTRVQCSYPLP